MTLRRRLLHTAPRRVEVQSCAAPDPGPGEVRVETVVSAVSAGTELLVYRGEVPAGLPLDTSIPSLSGSPAYPFAYGYACAGQVTSVGAGVDSAWLGKRVFCFHPHDSHILASPASLLPIPDDLSFEAAVFFPNLETAVNLVQDGRPLLGEDVIVFGAGIVGLLTVALLSRFPLARLVVVDPIATRRQIALTLGAHAAFDPANADEIGHVDLVYELSGAPAALNNAIAAARFAARIVVGSWYGAKEVRLDLGSRFHRERLQLMSSQVSTIAPDLSGRWDKSRRAELVWSLLAGLDTNLLITHRFPLEQALEAFALLDRRPHDDLLQLLFTYRP